MNRNLFCSPLILCIAITVIAIFTASLYGQGAVNSTGTGGKHTIQGTVFLPDGRRPDTPINVQLQSTTFTPLSIYSDKNGNFAFKSLSPGSYTIVVEPGEDFNITRENITIDPDVISTRTTASAKVITIPVYLQFKPGRRLINQVINAKLANIPKNALEHYEKALEFIRKDKIKESVIELRSAISLYPEFSIALTELGIQYLKLGKLKEALDSLRSSMQIDPNDYETKLNLGIALLNNRETFDAEKLLKEVVALNINAVTPHYYLGITLLQQKNLDEAQAEFELVKKLKSEKELPLVHKYLGGIYWAKKEYKLAADELEKYIKIIPDSKESKQIAETIKDLRKRQ